VLASFISNGWINYSNFDISPKDLLLNVDDGRSDFFNKFEDLLARFESGSVIERLTLYWALTERFVENHKDKVVIIPYEDICNGDFENLKRALLKQATHRSPEASTLWWQQDSMTTTPSRMGATSNERISGWEQILCPSQLSAIDQVLEAAGVYITKNGVQFDPL